jgi:hypothetical protein
MKVICNLDYSAQYTGSNGKTIISFEKGKTYNTITEYDDCYLFSVGLDFYVIKKDYFLTLEQVKKKRLFSFNKKRFVL